MDKEIKGGGIHPPLVSPLEREQFLKQLVAEDYSLLGIFNL